MANGWNEHFLITLSAYPLGEMNSRLQKAVKTMAKIPASAQQPGMEMNVWVTSGAQSTPLHFDDRDGLLCVAQGAKEVTLYPPKDSSFLYPLVVPSDEREIETLGFDAVHRTRRLEQALLEKEQEDIGDFHILCVDVGRDIGIEQEASLVLAKVDPKLLNTAVAASFYSKKYAAGAALASRTCWNLQQSGVWEIRISG